MARHFLLAILLCASGIVLAADPFKAAAVATQDEFLPVKEAYRPTLEFANHELNLHWEIADGYYLYRKQFAFRTATGTEVAARIPPGKGKEDEFLGHVEVYYHGLDIALTAPADTKGFTLEATAQGCADAGLCYPPTTWYWHVDPAAGTTAAIAAPPRSTDRVNPPAPHPAPSDSPAAPTSHGSAVSWLLLLLAAIGGGSILNLMPCVFPVLSLKVLAFASHKEEHLAVHGFIYTAGVVFSFVLVAIVLLALRAAGQAVGWGFQLQLPWFVAALAYLFFAMGLSLSGFWTLGGSWMGLGSDLAGRAGYSGSFFTGMLATLVASPCTAPFMASAVGFAATQPSLQALTIFGALGFGMALPMLVLCLNPRLLSRIPRPGIWMDRFKQVLAFPLYATAIWLCWVAGRQAGATAMMAVLVGALAITFGLWVWRFGHWQRALGLLAFALALAVLGTPLLHAVPSPAAGEQTAGDDWQPYSYARLAQLRASGTPVFVNATADWCITCLANEKVTLGQPEVKAAFASHGVTYLKADWTHYNAEITALLARFGRNGVPLYVFFPAGANSQPVVLPQLLRPSTVIAALDTPARP